MKYIGFWFLNAQNVQFEIFRNVVYRESAIKKSSEITLYNT